MASTTVFPFEQLRRWPDLESPELVAVDAADRLLLAEAAQAIAADPSLREAPIVVLGDTHGALTLGALAELGVAGVRVHQDARAGELALAANAERLATALPGVEVASFEHHDLTPELCACARLVLLRLPRSLAQLAHWSALVAAHAQPDVLLLAGGRLKHMTLGMNEVLATSFAEVEASLASQKSRVLRARGPQPTSALAALEGWPARVHNELFDLTVCAWPGAFAGAAIDIGTLDLLAVLDRVPGRQGQRILDFGCGTGVLAAQVARLRPSASVIATDQSAAAVASARATAQANGLGERIRVIRDDGLSQQPDASADLILFNPPFHSGAAVHAGTSIRLFAEAGRVLAPGGELWVVANRHLSYKPALRRLVGSTREVRRTPKFTVTASVNDGTATPRRPSPTPLPSLD
jgi:16S rRNA (guanine1207-N2)-methyltransferase